MSQAEVRKKNKVKYGLKNVYYALLLSEPGEPITYGAPKSWPGAVSIKFKAEGGTNKFYADDVTYYTSISNNGYSGDFESAMVPDDFRQEVMGDEADASGVLIENSKAIPKPFALMFEFDGDVNAIRHVLYNCKMSRPGLESKTAEDKIDVQTDSGEIAADPLLDPVTGKMIVHGKTGPNTTKDVYDSWYTKVHTPSDGIAPVVGTAIVGSTKI